jgi:diguanylate cyclase (GGDEF)-like protein/PAS domain S-box-containing protein
MPQNILLIQSIPSVAEMIRQALSRPDAERFHVEWVTHLSAGLRRLARSATQGLAENDIAALLIGLFLPDSSGIDTFERIFREAPQLPILILTHPDSEEIAKLAVRQGAQDYVLLDRIDAYVLPKTVRSMLERARITRTLFQEKERAQATLDCIGDPLICADAAGKVTFLNSAGESITGWSGADAAGHPIEEVCRIADATTHESVTSPTAEAIRHNTTVTLRPNCILIRRNGLEVAVEDSTAPIRDRHGVATGAVMVFRDVSAVRNSSSRLSYLAQHDGLTDLPNRLLFNDRLAQAIALAERHRHRLAVLFIDVDHFKRVNDSLGHHVGDRLLRSIAQRLLACARRSDTVSRQGGDEFVILLSELSHPGHVAVATEKVLLALSTPHRIDHRDLRVTASIGIAIYPEDGKDTETLLRHADLAMYHAKEQGRNNSQFFQPKLNAQVAERQSLENDLHHALERQEFVLHYQPKVNLQTGMLTGVEALLRWHHPQRGFVPPAKFIPIARECGLIVSIGRWVLREACHHTRRWQDNGLPISRVAVNISTIELRAADFVSGIRSILAVTGLAPTHLELELAETVLIQDATSTAAALRSLKDLGLHLALDEFGAGCSSLSYLKHFPADTLKISSSFVRGLAIDGESASIVKAIIGMGQSLRVRVVAAGIETRQQLAFLRESHCPEGQGYYFSQPMAVGEFTQYLQRGVAKPRPAHVFSALTRSAKSSRRAE